MVGGAPTVLSRPRAAALVALLAALALWEAFAGQLVDLDEAGDVAVVALLLIPATFGVTWLLLPLSRARGLIVVALALGVLAALLELAGAGSLFNVTKLVAYTLVGFWFLELFQALSWVVLVAAIIPVVDSVSVWRGPTKVIVEEKPTLFDRISVAFRLPGENGSVNLGPPDVLFFALFLAAAASFGLRVGWTWATTTALLGVTLALAATLDLNGLPALPAIALGFLLPNADLLWRALRSGARQT